MHRTSLAAVCAALALSFAATTPAHAQEPAPPATWTDSNTGLTWTACPLGYLPIKLTDRPWCDGERKVSGPWHKVVEAAVGTTIDGFSDWRVPTVDEVATVIQCEDDQIARVRQGLRALVVREPSARLIKGPNGYSCPPGYINPRFNIRLAAGHSWTTSTTRSPVEGGVEGEVARPTRIAVSRPLDSDTIPFSEEVLHTGETLLVRGGTPSPEWPQTIADARAMNAIAADRAVAEKRAEEQVIADQRAQTRQQRARAAEQREAYNQRTAALRANVRPGDRTAQGLVIQVRGNLVQVQTYPTRQCLGGCRDIPSELIWVERASLYARQ